MAGEDLGTMRGRIVLDVKQALGAYRQVRQQHQNLIFSSRQLGDAFTQSGRSMVRGGLLMVSGFALAVKASAEFERRMDFFQAVTNSSAKDMDLLRKSTLQMASQSIYSANQVADGFVELGKAGIGARQILDGVGQAVINLGSAADIPLIESGQILTVIMAQFGIAASHASRIADRLAGSANAAIIDVSDLGVSFKYVGGVASALGLGFDDVTTALTLLGKAGIKGSTAGTSLRQMMVSLAGATKPAEAALRELGIITGKDTNAFYDHRGALKPLSQVYQILQDKLQGYNQKQRLAYLRTIFNNRALSAAAILTRDGAKGFAAMNKEISKTSAADVASKRLDNLSGDIKKLKTNIDIFLIRGGTPFQKFLRSIVQSLTTVIQTFGKMPPNVQIATLAFFAISGALLILVGSFNLMLGQVFLMIDNFARLEGAGTAVKAIFSGLGRALLFLLSPLKLLIPLFEEIYIFLGPWGLLVLAIVAIAAGLYLAYKHSAKFRAIVDSILATLKGWGRVVISAIKPLVDWLARTIPVGKLVGLAFQKISNYIKHLKSLSFGGWVKEILKQFIKIYTFIPKMLLKLDVILLRLALKLGESLVRGLIGAIPGVAKFMAHFIGSILGSMVTLPILIIGFMVKVQNAFLGWLIGLVPRMAGLLGLVIGFLIGFFIRLQILMVQWAFKLGVAFIGWLITLPAKLASLWLTVNQAIINGIVILIGWVIRTAPKVATAFLHGIEALPGFLWGIISALPGLIGKGFSLLYTAAGKLGRSVLDGFTAWISEIPDAMSGIISSAIGLIKKAIGSAFSAMKKFGKGLWDGFKNGIGINSPSYVEKAMFALTANTQAETKKLARTTLHIQALSKKMAKTTIGPGFDLQPYKELALAQKAIQLGQNDLATSSGVGSAISIATAAAAPAKDLKLVKGELDISPDGKAFIRAQAGEVTKTQSDFDDLIRRMTGEE